MLYFTIWAPRAAAQKKPRFIKQNPGPSFICFPISSLHSSNGARRCSGCAARGSARGSARGAARRGAAKRSGRPGPPNSRLSHGFWCPVGGLTAEGTEEAACASVGWLKMCGAARARAGVGKFPKATNRSPLSVISTVGNFYTQSELC